MISIYYKRNNYLTKEIKKLISTDPDFGFVVPKLDQNSYIVSYIINHKIISFIHCLVRNDELTFSTAFTHPEFRRSGYSKELRQYVMKHSTNIRKFISIPLPNSHSRGLLMNMGFIDDGDKLIFEKKD